MRHCPLCRLDSVHAQVIDDCLKRHGNEDGGSYFLGATYSAAETLTTPWLARALVTLPAVRDIDVLAIAEEKGLDRFSRWVKVCLGRRPMLDVPLQRYGVQSTNRHILSDIAYCGAGKPGPPVKCQHRAIEGGPPQIRREVGRTAQECLGAANFVQTRSWQAEALQDAPVVNISSMS